MTGREASQAVRTSIAASGAARKINRRVYSACCQPRRPTRAHDWNTPMNGEMGAMSGWPFELPSLIPFYERAHDVCGLGPHTYRAEDYAETLSTWIVFRSDVLMTGVYRFGLRQVFTDLYPTEVTRAADIALYLHATVVSLETDRAGERVTRARIRCRPKTEFQIRASIFVLAAGGIENARLLLLSSRTNGGGLDDHGDKVGRCHLCARERRAGGPRTARLLPTARDHARYGNGTTHANG